jgi:hypothetical protein
LKGCLQIQGPGGKSAADTSDPAGELQERFAREGVCIGKI